MVRALGVEPQSTPLFLKNERMFQMATRKKVESIDGNENNDDVINNIDDVKETVPAQIRVRNELPRDMLVEVMNVTDGLLIYKSNRTNEVWMFTEHGDVQDLTLHELLNMRSSTPRFINEPWLLILNEDVVKYMRLTDLYDKIIRPEHLDRFFKMPDKKISDFIQTAPKGVKEMIIKKSLDLINNGNITVSKIKAIETGIGRKLEDYVLE